MTRHVELVRPVQDNMTTTVGRLFTITKEANEILYEFEVDYQGFVQEHTQLDKWLQEFKRMKSVQHKRLINVKDSTLGFHGDEQLWLEVEFEWYMTANWLNRFWDRLGRFLDRKVRQQLKEKE